MARSYSTVDEQGNVSFDPKSDWYSERRVSVVAVRIVACNEATRMGGCTEEWPQGRKTPDLLAHHQALVQAVMFRFIQVTAIFVVRRDGTSLQQVSAWGLNSGEGGGCGRPLPEWSRQACCGPRPAAGFI